MRRNTFNFVIDAVTLVVMLAMVGSGLVVRYVLPPGSGGHGGGPGLAVWGLGRHGWGDVHFWLAVAIGVLVAVHVALHWRWICATTRHWVRSNGVENGKLTGAALNLYGVGFVACLVVLVGGFFWVATASVVSTGGARGGPGRHADHAQLASQPDTAVPQAAHVHADATNAHDHDIPPVRGSMTLREAAATSGMAVDRLKTALGLPSDTPADERLGRLKRQHGFEMTDVRRALAQPSDVQHGRERKTAGATAGNE